MNNKGALWQLYVDGAARNNPGPAGAGIYLLKEGTAVEKRGWYLGSKTNNQAEYLALLFGLALAKEVMDPADQLFIKADSELMIRQILGQYRIKNSVLVQLCMRVHSLLASMNYRIMHIPRAQNAVADKLANEGIDKKLLVPPALLTHWQVYEEAL